MRRCLGAVIRKTKGPFLEDSGSQRGRHPCAAHTRHANQVVFDLCDVRLRGETETSKYLFCLLPVTSADHI
jgi:hypothetical protein